METSFKKVSMIGRLNDKPELKHFSDGKDMVTFSIPSFETCTIPTLVEPKVVEINHSCVAYGKLACDLAKLDKGAALLLDGEVNHPQYTDKHGIVYYGTQIVVQDVMILDVEEPSVGYEDEDDDRWPSLKVEALDNDLINALSLEFSNSTPDVDEIGEPND